MRGKEFTNLKNSRTVGAYQRADSLQARRLSVATHMVTEQAADSCQSDNEVTPMARHPHIAFILDSAHRYREGLMGIEGLQRNLSAVMSALEGDVPTEIHAAVRQAEARLERIRFTVNQVDRPTEVGRVLDQLEGVALRFTTG